MSITAVLTSPLLCTLIYEELHIKSNTHKTNKISISFRSEKYLDNCPDCTASTIKPKKSQLLTHLPPEFVPLVPFVDHLIIPMDTPTSLNSSICSSVGGCGATHTFSSSSSLTMSTKTKPRMKQTYVHTNAPDHTA